MSKMKLVNDFASKQYAARVAKRQGLTDYEITKNDKNRWELFQRHMDFVAGLPTLRKSTVEHPVAFVHAYLDKHPHLSRKDAIVALVNKGVASYTATTQVSKWRNNRARSKKGGKRT